MGLAAVTPLRRLSSVSCQYSQFRRSWPAGSGGPKLVVKLGRHRSFCSPQLVVREKTWHAKRAMWADVLSWSAAARAAASRDGDHGSG